MGDEAAASAFICSFLEYEKFLKMKVVQKPMCVYHDERKILMPMTLEFDVLCRYIQAIYIDVCIRVYI